ncbi:bifunctional [glutamate--ammonia ligase]-adenylyl-L-tyrosine phosphorylase/[glutamate--ammonia-ligase] adenylyltransferase [Methylophaga sp. OBS3]|uniref:bifunctional [glutamate--ammonia ligase]-adenylyl-L-tyrosine phosphorylase/[glutamate--ammonia-ligase] adenylyltransferase n=1 Tax=Methylophaga sp. OBS3 TaxID=2991934 RepID=UPI00225865EC|nr:bifunctional [glutamate--ammonia ligase]-adenylyl-L-tyrosine phosphorylase/[glutamate--ammonia-ligase] adenylyltransferase [Methylophaga sp. OBS3]MCX4189960.1 bifunctional [glutamate--ammonia ligase]-adenylyl-L-tyrosine phosphorylase/[glutamate--ammonia-ligase] adenylyltransferase [Methylophaga sp. OBS3]
MQDKVFSENWQNILQAHPTMADSARTVLAGSDYVVQQGERKPDILKALLESGDIERVFDDVTLSDQLKEQLQSVTDEVSLHRQLRLFRHRHMVRIIWRDLAGWSDLAETTRDLSALADACISITLDVLYQWQIEVHGTPFDSQGQAQQLVVLGMGKLGAGELNLSSDIDLIFCYYEDGETQGGRRNLTHEEFFVRLGRKLIQALDNVTADGFVFRVDMRLRPFGDSGALVASFDAMEEYYQTQGREWERYAMIKARPITGSEAARKGISELLRPFVYRRYLDYGMFDSLREMKSMIAGQLHTKGMEDNIKLGAGGIREIEFIGQIFQLIYGGRDKPLQQRPILTILTLLAERNLLSKYAVQALKNAYDFLRRAEHRIQAYADQQTHLLPQDDEGRQRLAKMMGFDSWLSFLAVLEDHRQQVHEHFQQLLTAPQADDEPEDAISLLTASETEKLRYLQNCGYQDPEATLETLDKLLNGHACRNLSGTGRNRLKKLLPLLVQAAAGTEHPDACLARLMPLLEAIMRRSAYIALLVENPLALSQLIKLAAASPLISHQLARYPLLLDELLDPRSLYEVPDRQEQAQRLAQYLASAEEGDLEQQMNRLREFRQIASLHVAAADVTGVLPLMQVGDQLSELAEIQLEQVLKLAWQYLVERHGHPPAAVAEDLSDCGFAVLAYGKLGGLELGYGSDLDLVFIFDDSREGYTNGDKPVDLMVFYTRLAQRMIHVMSTVTSGGALYEVDTRLRPSGNSGLLVTPLSGFAEYQHNEAWTWEHQALVRARCVLGDQTLASKFSDIRQQVLGKSRDTAALAVEVADMRQKMRQQLDKSTDTLFDLKQGVGGITDIEFLVQYAVLAWAADLPELMVYTDNIRILDALAATGKLTAMERDVLADAYRFYRSEANHCVLQEQPTLAPAAMLDDFRPQVQTIWQRWLGESQS